MLPKNGLPSISVFPNVAVEPARRCRSGEFMQRRSGASPKESEDSEDDQGDKENGQPG